MTRPHARTPGGSTQPHDLISGKGAVKPDVQGRTVNGSRLTSSDIQILRLQLPPMLDA